MNAAQEIVQHLGALRRRVVVPKRPQRDFGGIVRQTPAVIVHAECADDVAAAYEAASKFSVELKVRGAGHSLAGQTLVEGGIQVVNAPIGTVRRLAEDRYEIPARARWRSVERQLAEHGQQTPVLPDYLDLSVGGTLSVGGYGVDSIVFGPQVDLVEELVITRPDGASVSCSRKENADLFRESLAGLGRAGCIERAVLRTTPRTPHAAMFTYHYSSLSDLARSLEWLEGPPAEPTFFKGLGSRGRFVATYGRPSRSLRGLRSLAPPAEMAGQSPALRLLCPHYRKVRSLTVSAWVGRFGTRWRLWSDYLVDPPGLVRLTEAIETMERDDRFAGCLKSVYLLGVCRDSTALDLPYEASGVNDGTTRFLCGLYTMIPHGDSRALERVRASMRELLELTASLGGRPYRYGWHELDEELATQFYNASSPCPRDA